MKKKIILSLLALLVFFSVGAIFGVVYITNTTSELKRLVELYQVEELRRKLIINIQTVQSNLHTINTPFADELDSIVNNVLLLEESTNKCSECHHRPELADRIVKMQSLVKDYETHLSYFVTTRADAARLHEMKEEAVKLGIELLLMTGQMSHSATMSLDEKTDAAMTRITDVKIIFFITILITLLLSILVAARLTRSVTRPVRAILNTTRMIANGKFGASITYKDKTEFGELAEHFNIMSSAIKEGYDKIQEEVSERRQTEEALRQSEEKFRTFFEMSPFGIIIYPIDASPLNKELRFSTFNSAFHNFFRYTREEINSLSIADISYPEDLNKNLLLSRELISGSRDIYMMEKRYYNKKGEVIWGYISTTMLRDAQGSPTHIMTILVDINERKKIEEEQLKTEKLESVGILAGGIAHDFNNIMTSIMGNIALAKMSLQSEESSFEILKDAEEACRRAKDLTQQLLTFSKGGAPVKKAAFITDQLRDSARLALRGTNVTGEFFIPDDLWSVEIDEGQINQVIFNLIINAIQAMPGGGTIGITAENVSAEEKNPLSPSQREYVKISVRDHGTGISKDHLQKIFDPYFTTKRTGSGLGLSSSYAIIKNHDGYIEVESAEGVGTTFHVHLPATKGPRPAPERRNQDPPAGKGRILLMDDDDHILTSVGKTLTQIGYTVEPAREGSRAIEAYKQAMESGRPFDAVIMDLTIREGMGGRETMGKILQLDPDVKAIVSSGYSTDTIMANYRDHGFCGVITKPYQIEALNELLNRVIWQTT